MSPSACAIDLGLLKVIRALLLKWGDFQYPFTPLINKLINLFLLNH